MGKFLGYKYNRLFPTMVGAIELVSFIVRIIQEFT